jgi:hypothetical protein
MLAVVSAVLAGLVPTALPAVAAARSVEHFAAVPNVGPPLGYYYSVMRTCQHDVYQYYHNKATYRACNQAAYIVGHSGINCTNIAEAGIALGWISVATGGLGTTFWAIDSSVTIFCLVK